MKRWGLICFVLLLTACSQPVALEPTPIPATETPEPPPSNTPEPPPTETPEPKPTDTPEPLPTETPEPTATHTPMPSPTAVPVETFNTSAGIADRLTLFSETAVINREQGNRYLNGGAVIFHEGQFHLFSNFFNSWPGATTTYYYTSPDGQEWTRIQEEPLFTVEDVPLEGTGALILTGLVQPDGTWVLYYHTFTNSSTSGMIGRLTAPDPTGPWTFDETAVLEPGGEGEWDELRVMRVNVLANAAGDGYVMYYAGVNSDQESRIGLAFSADGIVWEKYDDPQTTASPYAESDPILEPQLDWEGTRLGRPEVVQTADGWVMLYEGGRGSQTGIALSEDGTAFRRYENNPILTRDNMVEGFPFFQGAFYHQDDTYFYLIEAGNGSIGTDIFLYTLEGLLLGN